MKLIGISGKIGAGKDTAYLLLKNHLDHLERAHTKIAFADKLKDICVLLFGWDRQRLDYDLAYKESNLLDDGSIDPACEMLGMTRREVMQLIGTEAMRNGLHKDVWIIVKRLQLRWGEFAKYDFGFLTDCRFLNELNFVRDSGGMLIKIVSVDKNGNEVLNSTKDQHASEQEWLAWNDWDHVIQNFRDPTLSNEENLEVLRKKLIKVLESNDVG